MIFEGSLPSQIGTTGGEGESEGGSIQVFANAGWQATGVCIARDGRILSWHRKERAQSLGYVEAKALLLAPKLAVSNSWTFVTFHSDACDPMNFVNK